MWHFRFCVGLWVAFHVTYPQQGAPVDLGALGFLDFNHADGAEVKAAHLWLSRNNCRDNAT